MTFKPTAFQQYLLIFCVTLLGALPFVVNDTILLDDILHYNGLDSWVFNWTIQIRRPMHAVTALMFGNFGNFSPTSTVLVALSISLFGLVFASKLLENPLHRICVALFFTTTPLFIDHWQYGVNHAPLTFAFVAFALGVHFYQAEATLLFANWRSYLCFLFVSATKQDFALFSFILILFFTFQSHLFAAEKFEQRELLKRYIRAGFEIVAIVVGYFLFTQLMIIIFQPNTPMPTEYQTGIDFGLQVLGPRIERIWTFIVTFLFQAHAHYPIGLKMLSLAILVLSCASIFSMLSAKRGVAALLFLGLILVLSLSIGLLREYGSTYRYTGLGALMLFYPIVLLLGLRAGLATRGAPVWLVIMGMIFFSSVIEIAKAGSEAATETKRNFGLVSQLTAEAALHSNPDRQLYIIDNCEAIDRVPNLPGWDLIVKTPKVWQTSMLQKGGLWCQSGLSKWLWTLTVPVDMDRILAEELTIPLRSPTELTEEQTVLIKSAISDGTLSAGLHALSENFYVFKLP
ncbi:MAG: hypothetical protein AAF429_13800 [Pseudomonadota bacterium]